MKQKLESKKRKNKSNIVLRCFFFSLNKSSGHVVRNARRGLKAKLRCKRVLSNDLTRTAQVASV